MSQYNLLVPCAKKLAELGVILIAAFAIVLTTAVLPTDSNSFKAHAFDDGPGSGPGGDGFFGGGPAGDEGIGDDGGLGDPGGDGSEDGDDGVDGGADGPPLDSGDDGGDDSNDGGDGDDGNDDSADGDGDDGSDDSADGDNGSDDSADGDDGADGADGDGDDSADGDGNGDSSDGGDGEGGDDSSNNGSSDNKEGDSDNSNTGNNEGVSCLRASDHSKSRVLIAEEATPTRAFLTQSVCGVSAVQASRKEAKKSCKQEKPFKQAKRFKARSLAATDPAEKERWWAKFKKKKKAFKACVKEYQPSFVTLALMTPKGKIVTTPCYSLEDGGSGVVKCSFDRALQPGAEYQISTWASSIGSDGKRIDHDLGPLETFVAP